MYRFQIFLTCLFMFSIVGCSRKPSVNILAYVGQPPAAIEAKLGKPSEDLSDAGTYVYGEREGVENLFFTFQDGKCSEVLVQFDSRESTSANTLDRVGLTENSISREADQRTDRGWTYHNQQFGEITFSEIKTLKKDGKYHGIRVTL